MCAGVNVEWRGNRVVVVVMIVVVGHDDNDQLNMASRLNLNLKEDICPPPTAPPTHQGARSRQGCRPDDADDNVCEGQ